MVVEGGAAAEIVPIDQRHAQAAGGAVPGGHQPADAAADDQQIEWAAGERVEVASHPWEGIEMAEAPA